eukprot:scaffold118293_cov21-Phaeocystis_antarctica.AAC.1
MGLLAIERGRRRALIEPRRNGRQQCAHRKPRSSGRRAHAQREPGRRATPAAAVTKRWRRRLTAQPELSTECAEWSRAARAAASACRRRACFAVQRAAAGAC